MNIINKLLGGTVVALTLGLTGCMWDDRGAEPVVDYSSNATVGQNAVTAAGNAKPVQKSYASKDPVQKSTPGPKRAAAPQLPVLQQ